MQRVEPPRDAFSLVRLTLSGAVVGLVVVLNSACSAISTTKEVPELIVAGEVVDLRSRGDDPPAIPSGRPGLLILALDGMNRRLLYEMLRSGELPELAALLGGRTNGGFRHAYFSDRLTATLPSSSTPGWVTAMTGAPPAEHGVAGNEFFVRERRSFAAPTPVSISNVAPVVRAYTDGYWNRLVEVPGVYEEMREREPGVRIWVSMHQYQSGADKLVLSEGTVFAEAFQAFVAAGADELNEHLVGEETSALYREVDQEAIEGAVELVEDEGAPDVLTVYVAGTDHVAHVDPEGPDKARRAYLTKHLDPLLGRLLRGLKKSGFLDDCFVVVTSDHGHTEVRPDDGNSLGTGGKDEPAELLRRAGFRPRPFDLEVSEDHDFNAVLAYQGAMAYLYVADRSTCPDEGMRCDWRRPPRYRDDVLALADAIWRNNRAGALVPELEGTLDMVLTRRPRPAAEKDLPFEVYVGDGRTVPIAGYLADHPRPEYVALNARLRDLAVGRFGERAGDILLIARNGAESAVDSRYYFGTRYHSWHGSPGGGDSELPLVVAHPEHDAGAIRELVERALADDAAQQRFKDVLLELRYGNTLLQNPSTE